MFEDQTKKKSLAPSLGSFWGLSQRQQLIYLEQPYLRASRKPISPRFSPIYHQMRNKGQCESEVKLLSRV